MDAYVHTRECLNGNHCFLKSRIGLLRIVHGNAANQGKRREDENRLIGKDR